MVIREKRSSYILIIYFVVNLCLFLFRDDFDLDISYGVFILILSFLWLSLGLISFDYIYIPNLDLRHRILNCRVFEFCTKLLFFVCIFVVLFLFSIFVKVISNAESLLHYRNSLFIGSALTELYGWYSGYLFYIATILSIFCISIGLYNRLLYGSNWMLVMSTLLLTTKEVILLSRYYLLPVMLAIFFILFFLDTRVNKKMIILFASLFFMLMISVFLFRGDGDFVSGFKSALDYSTVGYAMFTDAVQNNRLEIVERHVDIFSFFGLLGTKFYDYKIIFDEVQKFVSIGHAGQFNAFYTSLFLPYAYFGVVGLCFISFILGCLYSFSKNSFLVNLGFYQFNIYFIILVLFFSHQFFPAQLTFFWDYFIFSIIFFPVFVFISFSRFENLNK